MSSLLSSGLLAASMMLGQTGEPNKITPTPSVMQQQPMQRPIFGWFNREDRPVLSKIQGWWKRDQPETPAPTKIVPPRGSIRETDAPPIQTPPSIPPVNDFPRKLPSSSGQAPIKADPTIKNDPKIVQQVSAPQAVITSKVKNPILPSLASRIGRDEKFEWITGQIELENGNYVMYYATSETIDMFNGRIVLAPQKADLSKFKRGDLVSVRGDLVQRQTAAGVMPIYRITHAALIDSVR